MNIEGLSSASLERFIDSGWLNRLSDIFALKEHFDDMVKLDGYGEKSSQKICEAIEKSKNCTLTQFLTACGIPGIGKSQAKLISKYYGTWEDFIEAVERDPEDLLMIDGIGKKIMDNIIFWRDTDYINDGIPLIAKELTFIDEKSVADSPISGKVFCITGSLTHFTNRDTLVKNIELNGGRVSGSVSAKTDFLISNEKSGKGSKIKKALSLGIKIISEEEYKKILS